MKAKLSAYCILHGLVTLIIFDECYKLCSSSLYNCLQSLTSDFIPHWQKILLSSLPSNILNLSSSLNAGDKVSHPCKHRKNYSFTYILIIDIFREQAGRREVLNCMVTRFTLI
jgi:hypothetical protein